MIKVLAFTPGKMIPSSRFRVRQFITPLAEKSIFVDEIYPAIDKSKKIRLGSVRQRYLFPVSYTLLALKTGLMLPKIIKSHKYDATWVNRQILPLINLEKFLKKPLFFDVDDAIWRSDSKHIVKIATAAEVILAGNNVIAEWFNKLNPNIEIIPTPIDLKRFNINLATESGTFLIGWTGTSENLKYLYSIEKQIRSFLDQHSDSYLKIICDKQPNFKLIPPDRVLYRKWSPDIEVKELTDISVGLMPLENDGWAHGKCSYKMLQYMALGKPVIVSPIGMNSEIFNGNEAGFFANSDKDWYESLRFLYLNEKEGKKMGKFGYQIVKEKYSLDLISEKIAAIFSKYTTL